MLKVALKWCKTTTDLEKSFFYLKITDVEVINSLDFRFLEALKFFHRTKEIDELREEWSKEREKLVEVCKYIQIELELNEWVQRSSSSSVNWISFF